MSKVALGIAAITTTIALLLVWDRSGLIAWATLVLGVVLLGKIYLKPSRADVGFSIGLVIVPALTWIITFHTVISTWERGEVVELSIDTGSGRQSARVWVLDVGADPVVYYDAPSELAESLLAGMPLRFTRGGETMIRIPDAKLADALSEDEAGVILGAMQTKYRELNDAADIYYLMLGRSRDRVGLVVTLRQAPR